MENRQKRADVALRPLLGTSRNMGGELHDEPSLPCSLEREERQLLAKLKKMYFFKLRSF